MKQYLKLKQESNNRLNKLVELSKQVKIKGYFINSFNIDRSKVTGSLTVRTSTRITHLASFNYDILTEKLTFNSTPNKTLEEITHHDDMIKRLLHEISRVMNNE